MLLSLMALNIVWGYPWVGMLATFLSLLLTGWFVNWLTKPKLNVGCSLPVYATVGQAFPVSVHLSNPSRLPALDVTVGFAQQFSTPKRSRSGELLMDSSPWQFMSLIKPGENALYDASLTFYQRGIQPVPSLEVESTFPFHLFRSKDVEPIDATIAVAPAPLNRDEDMIARDVLFSVGNWAQKALSGEALEYVGSREYQVGMPVRRWDFASWARLGRPIVREFQSPTVRSMSLIVDTSMVSGDSQVDPLEYLLSLTVSVISQFSSKSILLDLYLTNEPAETLAEDSLPVGSGEQDSMLVRLAGAESVSSELADKRIDTVLEYLGNAPVLILTSRESTQFATFGGDVTVVSVADHLQHKTHAAAPAGAVS